MTVDLDWAPSAAALSSSIVARITSFLVEQVRRFQPEFLILMERKGTAVYRAALESGLPEAAELPNWDRVVSSGAIADMDPERLRDLRIMVVDDLLRTGGSVSEVLNRLNDRGLTDLDLSNVWVAVFACHEDAGLGHTFGRTTYPHAFASRFLGASTYRAMRQEIVEALQESGSLMLDTEHIEIRIHSKAALGKIAEALGRSGEVVAFHSAGNRTNLTVYYSADALPANAHAGLPRGSVVDNSVYKCRLVERVPGEFALIPISLPATSPEAVPDWLPTEDDRFLLSEDVLRGISSEGRFYHVALRASLGPLAVALKDLYAAGPELCDVYLPTLDREHDAEGFDLSHLGVMYPRVDLVALHDRLRTVCKDAEAAGRRLRRRKWETAAASSPRREDLCREAKELLQEVAAASDRRAAKRLEIAPELASPVGSTLNQIMECGRRLGLADPVTSAAMDLLIDEAFLVTRVAVDHDTGLVVRTYQPDGEIASELVRDYTRRYGLPSSRGERAS